MSRSLACRGTSNEATRRHQRWTQLYSRWELDSHERVAAAAGLSESKIATITAGQRPADLSKEEGIAYDVAACLSNGGQLHDTTYRAAADAFGKDGTARTRLPDRLLQHDQHPAQRV